jgi:hypothetical protein
MHLACGPIGSAPPPRETTSPSTAPTPAAQDDTLPFALAQALQETAPASPILFSRLCLPMHSGGCKFIFLASSSEIC